MSDLVLGLDIGIGSVGVGILNKVPQREPGWRSSPLRSRAFVHTPGASEAADPDF